MNGIKNVISEQQFDRVAMAAEHGQLKQRNDEFGVSFSIWLNGHMMMSSTVDENGDRHYWEHF
ncbi:hypothetical protein [Photobacterium indicum]|uniref:hypothetical protein n=1 Tax=Photobacterium indicum TaxID=81447 RepID=UPI003D1358A4